MYLTQFLYGIKRLRQTSQFKFQTCVALETATHGDVGLLAIPDRQERPHKVVTKSHEPPSRPQMARHLYSILEDAPAGSRTRAQAWEACMLPLHYSCT